MPEPAIYLEVAVPVPLRRTFDYLPPATLPATGSQYWRGCRVRIPFGNQTLVGVILAVRTQPRADTGQLKAAHTIIDDRPWLNESALALYEWASGYYHHGIGEVISAALPQKLRQGEDIAPPAARGWVLTAEGKGLPDGALKRAKKQQTALQHLLQSDVLARSSLDALGLTSAVLKAMEDKGLVEQIDLPSTTDSLSRGSILANEPLPLNRHQLAAVEQVDFHRFSPCLLEGVTGSGKTEVYLQLIARALQTGSQALLLIPEIGLSPQTISRVKQRFSVDVAELHSGVSEGRRAENWYKAQSGKARIVIGTRLAALCPLAQPGIIIVDEEHDLSYKQQDGFRYSARDICVFRAKQHEIPVILGSATPSLESLNNALSGRYKHLQLPERAAQASTPAIAPLDIRNKALQAGLSGEAVAHIKSTLQQGRQALVFLNRRGFAPSLYCHLCGWLAECNACELPMTLHNAPRHLHCHHCDRQNPVPRQCPGCRGDSFSIRGTGTEQLEEALQVALPDTLVIRIDRDTTRTRDAMSNLLEKAHHGEPCVLVGTQMLAKGHHIPGIALVVVADADQGLMSADYRGVEQLGQLITQVAGRAGREDNSGRVLIQTHQPEHPVIQCLSQQSYAALARQLLEQRQTTGLPPFAFAALFRSESKRPQNAVALLQEVHKLVRAENTRGLTWIGPVAAPIEKIGHRYRFQYQLISENRAQLHGVLRRVIAELENKAEARRTRWSVDIDPVTSA